MENNDILRELLETQKKTLLHARIRSLLILLVAAVVTVGVCFIVPANRRAAAQLTTLSGEVSELTATVNTMLEENSEAIAGVVENVSRLDPEGLNAFVTSMDGMLTENEQSIDRALANMSELDPEKMNDLMTSLNKTLETLNGVTDRLGALTDRLSSLGSFFR
ncbi:MAG: hypothetical protein IJU78_06020 [Clostridia bacterium]|nr:hypothetical protein [Clostridia bacterium]